MNDMDYPVERIQQMTSWIFFCGFTGGTCEGCRKRANVLAGMPGWMCGFCGTFNTLPPRVETSPEPFEAPDYGPTRAVIQEACGG